jgi:hypothetical protein
MTPTLTWCPSCSRSQPEHALLTCEAPGCDTRMCPSCTEVCGDCGMIVCREHRVLTQDSTQCRGCHDTAPDDEPEPSHDDTVLCCPECEIPNQFGELCFRCQREIDYERGGH